MAKQLRVDFAQMTDIGRKRTINQDNLAQRVPDDPDEIAQNGAIFIVADGMGGHAAGEIASKVAVNTIPTAYFEHAKGDVLQGLAHAIKHANDAILAIAHANTENAGMGTTLVAAVLCQGILYVANIGDSRAYLMRNGKLRQITEDHSWVAEQVRAGVLTEEQARNHVHRNVITRSLGTQNNVTADVFVEPSNEGDIIILCSDGLHGYVPDNAIAEMAQTQPPDDAVSRLVAMANEAGGPDNITVTIVHVREMPAASQEVLQKLQLLKDQPRPTRPMPIVPKEITQTRVTTPAAAVAVGDDATAKTATSSTPKRNAVLLARMVAVVLVLLFSLAAWFFVLAPFTQSRQIAARVSADIAQVNKDIASLDTLTPAQQLHLLAQDQQRLNADLQLKLTGGERAQIQQELDSQVADATRQALSAYKTFAHLVPLTDAGATALNVPCATTLLPPMFVAPASATPGQQTLFARNQNNQIVPITVSASNVTCGNPVGANVALLAGWNGQPAALIAGAGVTAPGVVTLAADGTPTSILALTPASDTTYTGLAYGPNAVAITSHSSGQTTDTLSIYTGAPLNPTPTTIQLTQAVRSLGFGNTGILYLLLMDGTLATLVPGQTSIHAVGDLHIPAAIPVNNPSDYTSATPVPTVTDATVSVNAPVAYFSADQITDSAHDALRATATPTPTDTPTPLPTSTPLPPPKTGASTTLSTASTLAVDGSAVPRLAVADGANHRVVSLQADGVDLALLQQYVDTQMLDSARSVTFSADSHTLYILTNSSLITIALP